MKDPPPAAIFRGFGESSLDLELWVFIPSRDKWKQLMNYLHTAIDKAFREAEIEISFPQRDLHLRTIGPLADVLGGRTKENDER